MVETENMMTVHLHGKLRKHFGRSFQLAVQDSAEAIRALCAMLPNFRQIMQHGSYKVKIDDEFINRDKVEEGMHLKGVKTLHLIPVISGAGSGRNGLVQTIIGVVLIVISIYVPQVAAIAQPLMAAGISMVAGGVIQMLTKPPKPQMTDSKTSQSSSFSNVGNVVAQGASVPLIYGEILVGSLVVSQGVSTYVTELGGTDIGAGRYTDENKTPQWVKDIGDDAKETWKKPKWHLVGPAWDTFGIKRTIRHTKTVKKLLKKLF